MKIKYLPLLFLFAATPAFGLGTLQSAAVKGDLAQVKTLVESETSLSRDPSTDDPAPLHMAAQGGGLEVVKYLVSEGANVNEVWYLNGHTPLIEATFDAQPEIVAFLLASGADTADVTLRGLTSSDLAAREADRNPKMKQILDLLNAHNRAQGCKADATGRYDVSAEEKTARLNRLLDHIDPPKPMSARQRRIAAQQAALQDAATKGDLREVKRLVEEENADVNTIAGRLGTTPLTLASLGGFTEIVGYLLKNGANPNIHERHPMAISPLFKAAVFGHLEVARLLLEAGAKVNEQGPANGMSPLHDAVFRVRLEVAKLLLNYGADPDLKDYTGKSPRQLAAGHPELEALFN